LVVCPFGAQRYVPPGVEGVAVNVADSLAHIATELTETVGIGLTVMIPEALGLEQPFRVYVTEYVVVELGETVIDCVVPPPDDQE
jgi:hypothetical protein